MYIRLMSKTFLLGMFIALLISCKGDGQKTTEEDTSAYDISTANWPKKVMVNAKAVEIINNWLEFKEMQTSFDALYNVGNTEDLKLILEDLIEKQKTLAESDYPTTFNQPQIKSRQKVFHTFVLKTKGDLIYGLDSEESVLKMINGYNALLNQMNTITSNTLDLKSLLDEE